MSRIGMIFASVSYRRALLLGLLSLTVGLLEYVVKYFKTDQNFDALIWNMTHFHMNYFDFGFIKRGLAGSVLAPLMRALEDGGQGEYLLMFGYDIALSVLFMALVLAVLYRARRAGFWPLLAVLLIAPTGFMQLGFDLGRYDHLNLILVVLALICVGRQRPLLAGLLLFVAVLNHEAVVVYGIPVVLAYAWITDQKDHATPRRHTNLLLTGILPILAAGLILGFGRADIDPALILPENVSLASSVWSREIIQPSLFLRKFHYLILLFYTVMPYLFLRWFYAANTLKTDLLFLAPFATLAMFALGVDYARWTALILFSCICVIALRFRDGHENTDIFAPTYRKLLLLAYVLPLGPIGITHPLPYLFALLGV